MQRGKLKRNEFGVRSSEFGVRSSEFGVRRKKNLSECRVG
ncbi:tRNA (Guanine37-N1)-methyltransferase [Crocosphaera watsonii WH 0402]|uniref:tRNA (Guanine37-N1)-methyltransferase n=2 Tax=Crocosphaera watsonii TaxID=263511 RepID=T2JKX8_CROWT|nr:Cytosine deaminase [Crocosphaera watsonii WH 0005]CCQ66498.1 tRNA (Guanine37-N1)-methyltransferase [Crocosphaera watsonii WH 0402]